MPQKIVTKNVRFVFTALIVTLILSFHSLFAQELPFGKKEIYRNAYKTAIADGSIGNDERSILNTIQSTLKLTDQEVAQIVAQIQLKMGYRDQSGRWLLIAQNMVYGSTVYGWMIPDILGVKDYKWYVGSEMISLAGTFYLTYLYTRNMELPHSRVQMIRLGSLLGLRYGFGLSTIFELDKNERKSWELAVMSAIPIGAYAGDRLFRNWRPSHGQSWALSLGAGIGGFSAGQIHAAFDDMPVEPDCPENMAWDTWEKSNEYQSWKKKHENWRRLNTIVELAGYPVGLYLARYFGKNKTYSVGDALMLTQGAASGSFYGLMLAQLFGADFDNPKWWLFPVAGMSLGAVLMDKYICGYDYSLGQSVVSALGTISGISFMAGISVITELKDKKIMSALMMAGGISGLYLTNKIFNLKKESKSTASKEKFSLMLSPSVRFDKEKGRTIPGFSLAFVY